MRSGVRAMTLERSSCSCDLCRVACERMPGFFRPGETAAAAALFGLTVERFERRYLATAKTHLGTHAVLPRIVGLLTGTAYGPYDRGRCVFLDAGGRCQIYAARPYECAHGNPCDQTPENQAAYYAARDETARLWSAP